MFWRGTGLGLSIVYGIVKQHDGVILVHSEPGVGSSFEIYLPLATADPVAMSLDTQAQEALPGGTETILLAEDDPTVGNFVREVLGTHGYHVVMATNGEEAVERFRESPDSVNLLLLDVLMPKKNGREAMEEIQGIRAGIRVVFMSGYTADVIQQRGQLDKALDVIAKPMSPAELLRRVRAALDA